jgi:uncharacterized ferredoxin-like protein
VTLDQARRLVRDILRAARTTPNPADGRDVHVDLVNEEGIETEFASALELLASEELTREEVIFWEAVYLANVAKDCPLADKLADDAVRHRRQRMSEGIIPKVDP